MTRTRPSTALEGLTVLDMTQARAGPICVRQLADWGANCIKIERPGDPQDWAGRTEPDFQSKHRNKRSMILDLKSDGARDVLRRLVEKADIVVENFRPAVKDRLGFDYESLRKINPRIILGSISAFGQDGPYRDRPGLDQIVQGMSGFMSITGEPGRGPLRAGVAISDVSCGLFCAIGILTALHERERSGEGQWVQTSLMESLLSMMDLHAARYLMEGHVSKQAGNGHPTGVPTNAYQTSDGYVNISIMPRMWPALCKAIEAEEATDDPRFKTRESRIAHRDECNAMISARMKTYTTEEMLARLAEYDCPAGPVYSIDQTFADPQVQHLKLAKKVTSQDGDDFEILRQPFSLSRTPTDGWKSLSPYGGDTNEIMAEFGFSDAELAALKEAGVVAGRES
ncbi:MAG: CoA transferase [Rhodospirillaceae bacterium]|jgi:formyl-CoA transferase|nr:CoA transferase [Rhodospirillaceae bacterium]MBT5456504.1 CoA transferase [Rhodospirillaceae bacterium]